MHMGKYRLCFPNPEFGLNMPPSQKKIQRGNSAEYPQSDIPRCEWLSVLLEKGGFT